jgi:hypothetical protein
LTKTLEKGNKPKSRLSFAYECREKKKMADHHSFSGGGLRSAPPKTLYKSFPEGDMTESHIESFICVLEKRWVHWDRESMRILTTETLLIGKCDLLESILDFPSSLCLQIMT